ncbi:alpha/beta fold hydrolase [Polymorphospora sp. NPDC050346]|uniref:thioesterase II family protein n=1 Tax=Polymorphospora sp. NPDC050346 TaxID=3155780 RepID=UPI0033F38E18
MTAPSMDTKLWIRRFHPGPAWGPRLVCFPHAGGSAVAFHQTSKALSPVAEVLSLQYPGRQDRLGEPCLDSIGDLADAIVAVLSRTLDRPLVFLGHSMGAVIAFEVAVRLERQGVVLRRLFASGRRAPSRVRDESIHLGTDDELVAEVQRLSGTEESLLTDPVVLSIVLPALRADYRAVETYRHAGGARLSCPVTVLTGDRDPRVSLDEAHDWAGHTTADCDVKVFTGGHFFLNDHPAQINDLLAAELTRPAG